MTGVAIILAAGEGRRLRPVTQDMPKCLIDVNGTSLIENALAALHEHGVRRFRIVAGYLGHLIESRIGRTFNGSPVEYVLNERYRTTNSMYSLYLGIQGLEEPSWVIEGDVRFESAVLSVPVGGDICWLVDSTDTGVDGAYLETTPDERATSLQIVRSGTRPPRGSSKSTGILRLDTNGVRQVRRWLKAGVDAGRVDQYYDLILADHCGETRVDVRDIKGLRWCEIDTQEDLDHARELFRR